MTELDMLLHRLREDAENHALQLECGQFTAFSVALNGETIDCTIAKTKVFREIVAARDRAIDLAARIPSSVGVGETV
jgi:hypothetical protein